MRVELEIGELLLDAIELRHGTPCDYESGVRIPQKPDVAPSIRTILVVSLRFMGDVLLTTPLMRSLRATYPLAAIDALVFAGTEGVLEGNPDLRQVLTTERGEELALWRRLWRRYDLAVVAETADRPHICGLILKLAREFGWGRLSAAINNLPDEQYYTYAVGSQFEADRYAVYPLPGRTLSLAAEFRVD